MTIIYNLPSSLRTVVGSSGVPDGSAPVPPVGGALVSPSVSRPCACRCCSISRPPPRHPCRRDPCCTDCLRTPQTTTC